MENMTKEQLQEKINALYEEIEMTNNEIYDYELEIEKLEEYLEKLNNAN